MIGQLPIEWVKADALPMRRNASQSRPVGTADDYCKFLKYNPPGRGGVRSQSSVLHCTSLLVA